MLFFGFLFVFLFFFVWLGFRRFFLGLRWCWDDLRLRWFGEFQGISENILMQLNTRLACSILLRFLISWYLFIEPETSIIFTSLVSLSRIDAVLLKKEDAFRTAFSLAQLVSGVMGNQKYELFCHLRLTLFDNRLG